MQNYYTKVILGAVLLGCMGSVAMAADTNLHFSSIRQQGMGGAGVAFTFDEHALYKNPAGLSRAGVDFNLPRLRLEVSSSFVDKVDVFQDVAKSGASKAERILKLKSITPFQGAFDFALSPFISFVRPGFGVGIFSQSNTLIQVNNPVQPEVVLESNTDIGGLVGVAMDAPFIPGVKMGISGGLLGRSVAYDSKTNKNVFVLDANDFLKMVDGGSSVSANLSTATGFGVNVGFLGDISTPVGAGTWGLAFNNIGATLKGTREVLGVDKAFEVSLPFTGTIGLGINTSAPIVGDFLLATDYRFISDETNFFKNLSIGVEKPLMGGMLMLRGGVKDGYITGGFGANLWFFQVHYAVYTEESGRYLGQEANTLQVLELGFLF
ncbi:MAG: hypothetical protein EXS67_04675 [Candidatus Margulisbacteria bacterium]|nr:hypothetical protein [Candidatus Margulisiibacteriota bacterium]